MAVADDEARPHHADAHVATLGRQGAMIENSGWFRRHWGKTVALDRAFRPGRETRESRTLLSQNHGFLISRPYARLSVLSRGSSGQDQRTLNFAGKLHRPSAMI